MVIKKDEIIVARKVRGASFLIDISDKHSGDKCAIYEISETSMLIWNGIDGTRSAEELADLLKAAIIDDVDYQILHDVVKGFIDTLIIRQFVEIQD